MLLAVLMICTTTSMYAQNSPDSILINRIENRNRVLREEKIHLHFDKSFYALGDTIWFAGYIVNAAKNTPDDLSRILHVDLINSKNIICKTLQLIVNSGFTAGDIILPDSLESGRYRIRAYTNWMVNFDPAYFFFKSITVVAPVYEKPDKSPQDPATSDTVFTTAARAGQLYNVQFFPEGGQLVYGLKSRIGFKVINEDGLGIPVTGKLFDNENNLILSFNTRHAGMGAFVLNPVPGKTYIAAVEFPDGSERKIVLPAATNSGYVLSADNSKTDSLFITLQATSDLINRSDLTFVPLSNGIPLFYMRTKFPDRQINITVPKNKLPGGILQLSLLDKLNQPVAERLLFNEYRQDIKMNIEHLKPSYQKKEPVELVLNATNVNNHPIIGSFSVSVVNADTIEPGEQTENTVLSNLLLTSDLKGFIENPNYYFIERSLEKRIEMDDLMLTQRWQRYTWSDLPAINSLRLSYKPEKTIIVSGQITSNKNITIQHLPIVLLAGQLISGVVLDTITDDHGRFVFNLPDNLPSLDVKIQVKSKKANEYKIIIDNYLPPSVQPNDFSVERAISKSEKAISRSMLANKSNSIFAGSIRLKELTVKDRKTNPKLPNSHSSNLNGPGQSDEVILPETLEKMHDLSTIDILLPGTLMTADKRLVLQSNTGTHAPPVLILVDGTDIGSDRLMEVSPRDIESIEFLKNPAYAGIYGIRGSGGVLLITTKKGNVNEPSLATDEFNSISLKLPFAEKREFYSGSSVNQDLPIAAACTTVYWKPDVITDENGNAAIQFYNTDKKGLYRITIEGIGSNGDMCRRILNYKVE